MVTNTNPPVIGITMGDPVGIGPEIIAMALANPELQSICRPVIFGDQQVIEHTLQKLGLAVELQTRNVFKRCELGPDPELITISSLDPNKLEQQIDQLCAIAQSMDSQKIIAQLRLIVPAYIPQSETSVVT